MRARVSRLGLAASAVAVVALAPAASAHSAATFYPAKWPSNYNEHWVFDNDVPTTTDWRSSVVFGIGQWSNGAGGNGPNFIFDGETNATNYFDACTGTRSKIFIREDLAAAIGFPSETVQGYTQRCLTNTTGGSTITQIQITFEKTPEDFSSGPDVWHTGATNPPSDEWDLRSIATHEAGHASGFYGHFTRGSAICPVPVNASINETMCEGNTWQGLGFSMSRTLETHDQHTYGAAY